MSRAPALETQESVRGDLRFRRQALAFRELLSAAFDLTADLSAKGFRVVIFYRGIPPILQCIH